MRISKVFTTCQIAVLALAGIAQANYFNGFETDTDGWSGVTRVYTGTGTLGLPSATGDYHGETTGAYTYWGAGGNDPIWPGGFTTSIDLYLDTSLATGTQFDWAGTISLNSGGDSGHYYVFNAGVYADGLRIGGSEALGDPTADYMVISDSGWYTLQHRFYDNGGLLGVELSLLDGVGTMLNTWTLGGPSLAGLGGSSLGYFTQNGSLTFALDNTTLSLATIPVPGALLLGSVGVACAGWHRRRRRAA